MVDDRVIKIGVCHDFDRGPVGDRIFDQSFRLALDDAFDAGVVDRPIVITKRTVEALPRGSAHNVLKVWKELAEEGVLAILGPLISDNCIAIREYIETQGRIPTLAWSGTDEWYGDWCFGATTGSLSEEPFLMAHFLASEGVESVAVITDRSAIGQEYFEYFSIAAEREGIAIIVRENIGQTETNVEPILTRLKPLKAGALVYLGYGMPAVHMNPVLAKLSWDPLKVMNSAFESAAVLPEGLGAIKGWVGVDQYDEGNPVAQDFLDRYEARYGTRQANRIACLSYDSGRLLALACGYARPLSPAGVKRGLEHIKMLPAATGSAGTYMSFAPFVRRCWLGPNYLVMREATGGETNLEGQPPSVLRHRIA